MALQRDLSPCHSSPVVSLAKSAHQPAVDFVKQITLLPINTILVDCGGQLKGSVKYINMRLFSGCVPYH